jgi:hypothetical protein
VFWLADEFFLSAGIGCVGHFLEIMFPNQ